MGRNIGVLGHSAAVAGDIYADERFPQLAGGDKILGKEFDDIARHFHESFRIPAVLGEEGKNFITDLILDFEKSGATIIAPHAYRATPFFRRNKQQNRATLAIASDMLGMLAEKKNTQTDLIWNFGSYFELNNPQQISIDEVKKQFSYAVDVVDNHQKNLDWILMEAANSIHEVIGLSHLCEQKDLPLYISFVGKYHRQQGLVIDDPIYGRISHLRAMELVREKAGEWIRGFGGNCGDNRLGYKKFLASIKNTCYYEQYMMMYQNECRTTGSIDHGCSFVPYKKSNGVWTSDLLKEHTNIQIAGICCGNTPAKNKTFVGELKNNGYTIENNF